MKKLSLLILMLVGIGLLQVGCSCTTWTKFWRQDPEERCAGHWHWRKEVAKVEAAPPAKAWNPCAAPRLEQTKRPSMPAGKEIELTKLAPKEVALNQPFDYRLKVTNLTDSELRNVVVTDVQPAHMRIESSDPKMTMEAGQIRWKLGAIDPKASKTISVNAVAVEMGTITTCAEVTYNTLTCARIDIVSPQLALQKFAPSELLKCERILLRYVIKNEGSGHACNIRIKDMFDRGLTTAQGGNEAMFEIASLGPGESRQFEAMADASSAGRFASKAIATSSNAGAAESDMTATLVSQPVLMVKETCPADRYIGRSLTYEIMLTNEGDGIARNTVIEASVPEETTFNSATDGGQFSHASPGKVVWNIGTLAPNSSKKVSMTLTCNKAGSLHDAPQGCPSPGPRQPVTVNLVNLGGIENYLGKSL